MHRSALGIIAVGLLASFPAAADVAADLRACAAVPNDPARLACFDALARQPMVPPEPPAVRGWQMEEGTSGANSRTGRVIWTEAFEEAGISREVSGRPALVLRCQEGRAAAGIFSDAYLGLGQSRISYSFDGGNQSVRPWSVSGKYASPRSQDGTAAFIAGLLQHQRLAVRLYSVDGLDEMVALFDLSGLSEALDPLRQDCDW